MFLHCVQVDWAPTLAMTGHMDHRMKKGGVLARGVQVACGGMHTLALIKVKGSLIVTAAGPHLLHTKPCSTMLEPVPQYLKQPGCAGSSLTMMSSWYFRVLWITNGHVLC